MCQKSCFVVIFESIFFVISFQSFAPAAQSRLASGVNYCYLVVWGPIAGTNTFPEVSFSSHLSFITLGTKCSRVLSHTKSALCFALSDSSLVRAPVSCLTVLLEAPMRKGAQGFHHISLLIASFNLPQMRPKSLWKILYSSLLIINKNFKWRNIF